VQVIADYDRCEGHGLCEEQAREVFQLDDEGNLVHRFDGQELPEELVEAAGRAAMVCPVAALRVVS
jgi:ferredoxin